VAFDPSLPRGQAADAAIAGLKLEGTADSALAENLRIADAAQAGNEAATRLVQQAAAYLASALVSATNLLDLDPIILACPGFDRVEAVQINTANLAVHPLVKRVKGTLYIAALLSCRTWPYPHG
jgi:predicted NBD/HSP70 family sugar kinase